MVVVCIRCQFFQNNFVGYLSQSVMPNVSSVRSVKYSKNGMLTYKVSGIGTGQYVAFKHIKFEMNMLLSGFDTSINGQLSTSIESR